MSELRSCPSCESTDVESTYPDRGYTHVYCGDCGMRGPSVRGLDEAESAWNRLPRRPGPPHGDGGCSSNRAEFRKTGRHTQAALASIAASLKSGKETFISGCSVVVVAIIDPMGFLREQE